MEYRNKANQPLFLITSNLVECPFIIKTFYIKKANIFYNSVYKILIDLDEFSLKRLVICNWSLLSSKNI